MTIAVTITAAGRSLRFGADKLSYPCFDSTLGEVCLSLFSRFDFESKIAVLNSAESILYVAAQKYGYKTVINSHPENGLSSSVKLAVRSILSSSDPDGILFANADMPFIHADSIEKLICLFQSSPENICSLSDGSSWGKPVIFPRYLYDQFDMLSGDVGGKIIIKQNMHLLKTIPVSSSELADIDTFEEAKRLLN